MVYDSTYQRKRLHQSHRGSPSTQHLQSYLHGHLKVLGEHLRALDGTQTLLEGVQMRDEAYPMLSDPKQKHTTILEPLPRKNIDDELQHY
jgi:hypothetical protein